MLNSKQYDIIKYLFENLSFVNAATLAKQLAISSRTVQRYVDIINEEMKKEGIEIDALRGNGYKLLGKHEVIAKWLNKNQENNAEQELRIREMIRLILDAEQITIEMLAVKMNYSVSTLTKMTSEVKLYLRKYDLNMVAKPYYGLSIVGKEINIRTLLIDCGFVISNNSLKVTIPNISRDDFELMDNTVLKYLNQNHIVIADRDINDLLARVIICMSRCKQRHYVENLPMQKNVRHHNFDIIYAILNEISQEMGIVLNDNEYNYVSIYSGFIIYNYNPQKLVIKEDIQQFVQQVIEEISIVSGIDFNGQEHIINSLCMHLNILLTRINKNVTLKNPLLQQIKSNYAMEMNYAIFMAKKIEEKYNVQVSEDELGYLAMYFGSVKVKQNNYKRIVILCNYGVGTAQLIGERIKQEFSELEVVGIYPIHYLELATAQDIDLIVSTIQIENYDGNKPLLVVDNLLAIDSLAKIKEALYDHDSDIEKLARNFNELAWYHIAATDKNQVIKSLGDKMIAHGLINAEIVASILEREEISSTDIGNMVAIPHTIFNDKLKSVIGVGILDKVILWDKERVQLVFMICFDNADKVNGSSFRHLYKAVKEIASVNKMISAHSYNEFMQILKGERK